MSDEMEPCPNRDCKSGDPRPAHGERHVWYACPACGLSGPKARVRGEGDDDEWEQAEAEAKGMWNDLPRDEPGAPTLRDEVAAVLAIMDAMPDSWTCCEMIRLRCRDRLRAALERSGA